MQGIFFLLLSAFLYSIMPVLIRFLGNDGIPPLSQVFLRYGVAFLCALIYYFSKKQGKITLQKKDLPLLALATIGGYGLTNVFYTYSILTTQVSTALFLFFTFALIAPVLAFIFLKEKINTFNVIALFVSFLALLLLFQPNAVATWKVGGIFALLSALAQATYVVTRKKLSQYSSSFMMLANTLMGFLVVGMLSVFWEQAFYLQGGILHVSVNTWLVTILFGIDNFLAWFMMTKGFEYFKASSGSIILLSELIFGILFAFLFFQEVPTLLTWLGGILILFASILVILKGKS